MLSIKDFKPGHEAYILYAKRGKTEEYNIEKCFIISVGRKYVKVGSSPDCRFPTEYCNLRGYDDYYSPKETWYDPKRLFPTYQQAAEHIEKDRLRRAIKEQIHQQKLEILTLAQLHDINEILKKFK